MMSEIRVLIVEDEENLRETLSDYLEEEGFVCSKASSILQAKEEIKKNKPHIILLDLGLPDGNGMDLAIEVKQKYNEVVIIFLSALNDPETKFKGLELGAQDFITKPFDVRELKLRLNRIIENQLSFDQIDDEISIDDLKIWFKRYELLDGKGKVISLSQKECSILKLLYLKKNTVISRDEIIDQVWGKDSFPSNRTVDNYIVSLRKWLESSRSNQAVIKSIRGIGYKFEINNKG